MAQVIPNAEEVSAGLRVLMDAVEELWVGQAATGTAKARVRRIYRTLQDQARTGAVMTIAGIRLIRTARCDKATLALLNSLSRKGKKKAAELTLHAANEQFTLLASDCSHQRA